MLESTKWYHGKVLKGDQTGRTINIPTINLDSSILPVNFKQGIYAALIKYNDQIYKGALYIGPRLVLGETHTILEINLFNFDEQIYNESVSFQIKEFIRGIQDFASLEEMKKEIERDVQKINDYFAKQK